MEDAASQDVQMKMKNGLAGAGSWSRVMRSRGSIPHGGMGNKARLDCQRGAERALSRPLFGPGVPGRVLDEADRESGLGGIGVT